jgi:hypothetical protein
LSVSKDDFPSSGLKAVPRSGDWVMYHNMHLETLRKRAAEAHQILRVIFCPDVDSVENPDTLSDIDELAKIEFLDVPKK